MRFCTNKALFFGFITLILAGCSADPLPEATKSTGQTQFNQAPSKVLAIPADKQVAVNWQPSFGAVSYTVFRTDSSGSTEELATTFFNRYIDRLVDNDSMYTYAIRANFTDGQSSVLSAQATTTPTEPTARPQPVKELELISLSGTTALSWKDINGANGYILYYTQDNELTKENASRVLNANAPYLFSLFEIGEDYRVAVSAINILGESALSEVITVRPRAEQSSNENLLGFTAKGLDSSVLLTWPQFDDLAEISLEYRTPQSEGWQTIGEASSPYTHVERQNGIEINYRLVTQIAGVRQVLAFASATPSALIANISIGYEDANLDQCIQDNITAQGAVYVNDVKTLNCRRYGISDLFGIEIFSNLQSLNLAHNSISNISPLGNLSKLNIINLYRNNISDVSVLQNLPAIEKLSIYGNNLQQIDPLLPIATLKELDVSDNPLTGLPALQNVWPEIREFAASNTGLVDISALDNLTTLQYLDLADNNITDISPLLALTELRYLDLSGNLINAFLNLRSALQNLIYVNLTQRDISNEIPALSYTNIDGVITFSWTEITSAQNYTLYRIVETEGGEELVSIIETEATSVEFTLEDINIVGERAVISANITAQNNPLSNIVFVRPEVVTPESLSRPIVETQTAIGAINTLTWEEVPGAVEYEIRRYDGSSLNDSGSSIGNQTPDYSVIIQETVFVDTPETGLIPGTDNIYLVAAINGEIRSPSAQIYIYTAPLTLPLTPHSLSVNETGESLEVTWEYPGASDFDVYFELFLVPEGEEFDLQSAVNGIIATRTQWYVYDYIPNQAYDVYVRARIGEFFGDATSVSYLTRPAPPSNIAWEIDQERERYEITWDPSPGVIYTVTLSSGEGSEIPFSVNESNDGFNVSLEYQGETFDVYASNPSGQSFTATSITLQGNAIVAPTFGLANLAQDGVSITWSIYDQSYTYIVHRLSSPDDDLTNETVVGRFNAQSGNDLPPTNGTYYYALEVEATAGKSQSPTLASIDWVGYVPNPPAQVNTQRIETEGGPVLQVNWEADINATSYRISEVENSSGSTFYRQVYEGTDTTFEILASETSPFIDYVVVSINSLGASDEVEFDFAGLFPPPDDITGLNASAIDAGAQLSWETNNATTIIIRTSYEFGEGETGSQGRIELSGDARSYTFRPADLVVGATYTFEVTAYNRYAQSPAASVSQQVSAQRIQDLFIPNQNLLNCVRATELEYVFEVTNLDCSNRQLSSIEDIDLFYNLTSFTAQSNLIQDLTPASLLENLSYINVQNNTISDLRPMAGMSALTTALLSNNNITDVTSLAGLENLTTLYLTNNKNLVDVSPLAEIKQLVAARLDFTGINDIEFARGHESLYQIFVSNTNVTSLEPLSNASNIGSVVIANTGITDLSPILDKDLTELGVDNTDVPAATFASFNRFTSMRTFTANNTAINDISFASQMPELWRLRLNNTAVQDISPVTNLLQLRELMISYTNVSDLTPIGTLPVLETLHIDGLINVSLNFALTSNLPIKTLSGTDLGLDTLQGIQFFPQLETLDVSNTGAGELENDFSATSVLSPLEQLNNLQTLRIGRTGLFDVNSLYELNNLQLVDLIDNTGIACYQLDELESIMAVIRPIRCVELQ